MHSSDRHAIQRTRAQNRQGQGRLSPTFHKIAPASKFYSIEKCTMKATILANLALVALVTPKRILILYIFLSLVAVKKLILLYQDINSLRSSVIYFIPRQFV